MLDQILSSSLVFFVLLGPVSMGIAWLISDWKHLEWDAGVTVWLACSVALGHALGFAQFINKGYLDAEGTISRWIDAVSWPVDTTGLTFNTTAFWPYYFPSMIALVAICLGVVYWDERKRCHR